MLFLKEHCPRLVKSFLPNIDRESDLVEVDSTKKLVDDPNHRQPRLSIKGFRLTAVATRLGIKASMKLPKLGQLHPFIVNLREAYGRDYGLEGITDWGNKTLKWSNRIAFTSAGNKRCVYRGNDFVVVQDDRPARLLQCFTHVYRQRRYSFFIVQHMKAEQDSQGRQIKDNVLGLDLWSACPQYIVYGLPALKDIRPYFIQVSDGPWLHEADIQGGVEDRDFLLKCDWNLSYL